MSGGFLVTVTDVVVAGLGVRMLLRPADPQEVVREAPGYQTRLVLVAAAVGFSAGLLANSGGFLLAPLYLTVLRLPVKPAFACSLAVSAALAVPGTIVHAALGHIDWTVVALFAVASVPLSYLGARVAVRANSVHLVRAYGVILVALGVGFLAFGR